MLVLYPATESGTSAHVVFVVRSVCLKTSCGNPFWDDVLCLKFWVCLHTQGSQPSTSQILELRNTLLASEDLRQPSNFKAQIERASGLSEDAGKSLFTLLQARAHTPCAAVLWFVRRL